MSNRINNLEIPGQEDSGGDIRENHLLTQQPNAFTVGNTTFDENGNPLYSKWDAGSMTTTKAAPPVGFAGSSKVDNTEKTQDKAEAGSKTTSTKTAQISGSEIIGLPYLDSSSQYKDLLATPYRTLAIMKVKPITFSVFNIQKYLNTEVVELEPAINDYKKMLKECGITFGGDIIKVALSSPPNITEAFSNNADFGIISKYLDTKYSSVADIFGVGAELGFEQSKGYEKLTSGAGKIYDSIKNTSAAGFLSNMAESANDITGNFLKMDKIKEAMEQNAGGLSASILAGHKINLPKTWSGSRKTFTYNFDIKLFCANPANDDLYMKKIVAPLAMLLSLAIPQNENGETLTYGHPFYLDIDIPALVRIKAGLITTLSVTKGGAERAFNVNNRPLIVDVTMQVEDLYDVLVGFTAAAAENNFGISLKEYVENLQTKDEETVQGAGGDSSSTTSPTSAQDRENKEKDRVSKDKEEASKKVKEKSNKVSVTVSYNPQTGAQVTLGNIPTDIFNFISTAVNTANLLFNSNLTRNQVLSVIAVETLGRYLDEDVINENSNREIGIMKLTPIMYGGEVKGNIWIQSQYALRNKSPFESAFDYINEMKYAMKDPYNSISVGAKYLADMKKRYNNDQKMYGGYFAGPDQMDANNFNYSDGTQTTKQYTDKCMETEAIYNTALA